MFQYIYVIYDSYTRLVLEVQEIVVNLFHFIFNNKIDFGQAKAKKFDPNHEFCYTYNITTIKDRMIRISCIQHQLLQQTEFKNPQLLTYLKQRASHPQLFVNITPQNLLDHCDIRSDTSHPGFVGLSTKKFRDNFDDHIDKIKRMKRNLNDPTYWQEPPLTKWDIILEQQTLCFKYIFLWFILPLFVVTRVFILIFPIIVLIEEIRYYVKQSDESISIDLIGDIMNDHVIVSFQVGLLIIYYILVILWIVYFFNVVNFYYWVKLAFCGPRYYYGNKKTMNAIVEEYNEMYDNLFIQGLLCDTFENDIASVIFEYYLAIVEMHC